jgi:hypothetical protein
MENENESPIRKSPFWVITIALGIAWFLFSSVLYLVHLIIVMVFHDVAILPVNEYVGTIGMLGFIMILVGFIMLAKTYEQQ